MSSIVVTHAHSLPFRVKDVAAFLKHLDRYVGVTAEILNAEGMLRLNADQGTWEVYEVVDGNLAADIIDLDDLVVPHLEETEVAVFLWTRVHDNVIDSGVYAVNGGGQSHGDSLNSTAQRALASLGAAEDASVVQYLNHQADQT